jgi:hypothetical protein
MEKLGSLFATAPISLWVSFVEHDHEWERKKVGPYLQIMIIKMKKNEELKDFETVGKDDRILKDGLWEF